MRRSKQFILAAPVILALFGFLSGKALLANAHPAAPQATVYFVDDSVSDGLAGHWKFDEPGSTTALEFVNSANGTLNSASMSAGPLPPVNFIDLGILSLDGVTGFVTVTEKTALNLRTVFSLSAWVKRSSTGTYDAIYDSGTQANRWWVFIADSSTGKLNRLGFGERGIAEVYSTVSILDTNWHHIAVVKNGDGANNLAFFVDGNPAGQASVDTVTQPSGSKHIGALIENGSVLAQFGGNLDDVRLYNRALSNAEITRLASGAGCATDGTSWSQAFRELQCALDTAVSGDDIWIGEGVYRPGVSPSVAFSLKNGVNLYGNFRGLSPGGNESFLSQRPAFNPAAPLTVLSGDILRNDIPAGFGNYSDNTRHVLVVPASSTNTIDSLGVRGGNATGVGTLLGDSGGGLGVRDLANLTLEKVVFFENRASSTGGAIYSTSPLQIRNSVFKNNQAATSGGAVNAAAGASVYTSTFSLNAASSTNGGAILSDGPITIKSSNFFTNTAANNGGAIYASQSITLSASTLISNTAVDGGAAFFMNTAVLSSNLFERNRAIGGTTPDGGGFFAQNGPLTSNHNSLTNNHAGHNGGGAVLSNAVLTSDRFLTNHSGSEGAGLQAKGNVTITLTIFDGNQGFLSGAVVASGLSGCGNHLTILNSLFIRNSTSSSNSGIDGRVFDLTTRLVNNTYADPGLPNPPFETPSILVFRCNLEARNNVFANYEASLQNGGGVNPATVDEDYNLRFNAPLATGGLSIAPGAHSLSADPFFINPAAGDYRIKPGSPAANVALDSALPATSAVDLSGLPRRIGPLDIGAYEVQGLPIFLPLVIRK